jgi:hypothetical protein
MRVIGDRVSRSTMADGSGGDADRVTTVGGVQHLSV